MDKEMIKKFGGRWVCIVRGQLHAYGWLKKIKNGAVLLTYTDGKNASEEKAILSYEITEIHTIKRTLFAEQEETKRRMVEYLDKS